jgi:hypothetical protein
VIDRLTLYLGKHWYFARFVSAQRYWEAFWRREKKLRPEAFR